MSTIDTAPTAASKGGRTSLSPSHNSSTSEPQLQWTELSVPFAVYQYGPASIDTNRVRSMSSYFVDTTLAPSARFAVFGNQWHARLHVRV